MRIQNQQGQSIVEYLAVAAAIIIVVLAIAPKVGAKYDGMLNRMVDSMDNIPAPGTPEAPGDGGKA